MECLKCGRENGYLKRSTWQWICRHCGNEQDMKNPNMGTALSNENPSYNDN